MKILVTGATGFIGRHLAARLAKDGSDLVCLVRKTSKIDFLRQARIPLVYGDIAHAGEVDNVFGRLRPDVVFHCAGSVQTCDEKKLRESNIEGTRLICKACLDYGVKKLIYLSSVAVVSGNPDSPLTDDLPYEVSDAYGRSKAEAERIVIGFRGKGLCVSVIRPCIVYGADEPHGLGKILQLVKHRRLPVLNVPGMDSRLALVYIENLVQAMILAIEKDESAEGTFMIADKEIITLRKLLEILYDELGKARPPVVPAPIVKILMLAPFFQKKADRIFKDRVYDISRARELLGYDPQISTEEGLRKSVRGWKLSTE